MPDLIRHFFAQAEREGLPPKQLDQAALERLKRYRWPGNVRELENLARRLAALYPQETISARRDRCRTVAAREHAGAAMTRAPTRDFRPPSSGIWRPISPVSATDLPPPGLYHRLLREIEHPLADGDAGGDPRQSDPRGGAARGQSQHAAQENPRPGYSGFPPRRLSRDIFSRPGLFGRPGFVVIRQHCCIKASSAVGEMGEFATVSPIHIISLLVLSTS